MQNLLLELFDDCLSRNYRQSANGASWDVEQQDGHLTVYFQKSNGIVDWINNADLFSVPYREMNPPWQCHGGFLRVWKSVKPLIEPYVLNPSVQEITVVGYSHGAALSVLCHEFIYYRRRDLRDRLKGFGFGCPRVLYGCVPPDVALRWERFYVIRNLDDLVTHLPPRTLGYCHVGNLVEIGEAGLYSAIDAHRPESYRTQLAALSKPTDKNSS